MELTLAWILVGLVIAVHLFTVQSSLLAWKNARRGRFDLDALQVRTGLLRRAELEALVGAPGPDSLYRVDAAAWARLPRQRLALQILLGPVPGVLSLALGLAAAAVQLSAGAPAWGWVGAAVGAFACEIAISAIYVLGWSPDDEVDELELPEPEELETLGAIPCARALGGVLDLELRRVQQNIERTLAHGGLTWCERTLLGFAERWSRRSFRRERLRAAKLLESTEALAEQVRHQREALRVLIRSSDDLDEAVELCEQELKVDELLRDLEGESAAGARPGQGLL
ncbi:MAG: hypothetical protein R3F62_20325 [Planctomycetota bacterium]